MQLSLSHRSRPVALERSTRALSYINAVTAAGATVTPTQEAAIYDFFTSSTGFTPSIKRLYLPIWGAAAPNAICMVSGTSGTFNGSVTHAAGYVVGDGATGYFDVGASPSAIGQTTGSAHLSVLFADDTFLGVAKGVIGAWGTPPVTNDKSYINRTTADVMQFLSGNQTPNYAPTTGQAGGVVVACRTATNRAIVHFRRTAGFASGTANTNNNTGTVPTNNAYAMAFRSGASPSGYNTFKFGAWSLGLGLDDSSASAYSLALKNLWETCTGLTLP